MLLLTASSRLFFCPWQGAGQPETSSTGFARALDVDRTQQPTEGRICICAGLLLIVFLAGTP